MSFPIERSVATGSPAFAGDDTVGKQSSEHTMFTRRALMAILLGSALFAAAASAQEKSIVVASTTSTQDSGLFGVILPLFKSRTGIDVKVVALGTGQAL